MANYASIQIVLNSIPTLNDQIEIQLDSLTPLIAENPATSRVAPGNFEINNFSIPPNTINLQDAFILDYVGFSALIQEYPINVTTINSTTIVITATEYFHSFSVISDPSWANITITPEVLPAFNIIGVTTDEADVESPNTHVKFTASVEYGQEPYNITSPVSKAAPLESNLFFDYNRYPGSPATLSITDDNSDMATFTLPRVDVWQIDNVNVTGIGAATVTIYASRLNTGDVTTTVQYSLNGVDYQSSNIFNNVYASGTAYVRDSLGAIITSPFTVTPAPEIKSSVGFYRYKVLTDSNKTIQFSIDGAPEGTKEVVYLNSCDEDLLVKFLDESGQYRFFNFYSKYETSNSPQEIGRVNKFITDIKTDQSNESSVGYENEKTILASIDVNSDMLPIFSQMYTSPRVYLYVGGGSTDLASDWLEVFIDFSNPISKLRQGNSAEIEAIITLPKQYSVKMI